MAAIWIHKTKDHVSTDGPFVRNDVKLMGVKMGYCPEEATDRDINPVFTSTGLVFAAWTRHCWG